MKQILLLLFTTLSMPAFVSPPQSTAISFDSLPTDVKKLIVPLIANSNVSEVAKTIVSLNQTNTFFRNFVRSENGFISILEKMPYTANAVDLVQQLRKDAKNKNALPVLFSKAVNNWYQNAENRLTGAKELFEAIDEGVSEKMKDIKEGEKVKNLGGNVLKVKDLLSNKNINLNANARRSDDPTPLIMAVLYGNEEIVKLLLEAGANPNVGDFRGNGILNASIACKPIDPLVRKNIVQILINAGVDINFVGYTKVTALMVAALNGDAEVFKILLEAGANPLLKDDEGKRALDYATDEIQKMVCDAFIQKK